MEHEVNFWPKSQYCTDCKFRSLLLSAHYPAATYACSEGQITDGFNCKKKQLEETNDVQPD